MTPSAQSCAPRSPTRPAPTCPHRRCRSGCSALAEATGQSDGELRAALAFSQGIGLAVARHLIALPVLVNLPDAEVERLVEPNLRRYLTGVLDTESK